MSPADSEMVVKNIPMDEIFADAEFNCRGTINPIDVIDLARDMQDNGLQQPIAVQPWDKAPGKKWRVVMGHRRHKAAEVIQWPSIACVIKEHLSDVQARVLNLTENVNRKDLNMLQEAKAIQNLTVSGLTQEEIGDKIHQSRGWVQVRCYLLTLPEEIQQEAAAGNLSYQQIRDLYTIGDKNKQYEAVKRIKDAKERGEKSPRIAKQNKNTLIKKRRDRGEIFAMMEHIQEYLGNNLATRGLAWAAGEITDNDMFHSIKEACDIEGTNYEIPKEALNPVP